MREENAKLERQKQRAVKKQLEGLDYELVSRFSDNGVKNQVLIGDFSIIWHKYSYGYDEPDVVEVMYESEVSVWEISKLRELIDKPSLFWGRNYMKVLLDLVPKLVGRSKG